MTRDHYTRKMHPCNDNDALVDLLRSQIIMEYSTVLEVSSAPSTVNPTGSVKSGCVKILGPVIRVKLNNSSKAIGLHRRR